MKRERASNTTSNGGSRRSRGTISRPGLVRPALAITRSISGATQGARSSSIAVWWVAIHHTR